MAGLLAGIKGGAALKKVDESEIRDASGVKSAGAVVGAVTEKKPEAVQGGVSAATARANLAAKFGGGGGGGGGGGSTAPRAGAGNSSSNRPGMNSNHAGAAKAGGGAAAGGGGFKSQLQNNATSSSAAASSGGGGALTEARLLGLETRLASIEAKLDRLLEIAGVPV
jgi:hypothetical protein